MVHLHTGLVEEPPMDARRLTALAHLLLAAAALATVLERALAGHRRGLSRLRASR